VVLMCGDDVTRCASLLQCVCGPVVQVLAVNDITTHPRLRCHVVVVVVVVVVPV